MLRRVESMKAPGVGGSADLRVMLKFRKILGGGEGFRACDLRCEQLGDDGDG